MEYIMKQQEINAFLAIAKYGTISAAAAALNYAQPTLSGFLHQLEQSLGGIQLVKRMKGKRGVVLTPAGHDFYHLAMQHAELDKRFERFVKEHQKGTLRLAASVVSHQYIVCHLIQKLLRAIPDVEIRLSTLEIKDVEQAIRDHSFDIAISYDSPTMVGVMPKHITKVPLFQEEYCILCPIDTPLPNRVLSPKDLDMDFEVVHQGYGNQLLQNWRETNGLENRKPYFVTSSMLSVHTYLMDPRCWGFTLANAAHQAVASHPESLTLRRISPTPEFRTCNALISNSYPEENITNAFLRCMDEFVAENPHLRKCSDCDNATQMHILYKKNGCV